MLVQRQTSDDVVDPGDKELRVNLLNWDGRGRPAGLFPPRARGSERPPGGVDPQADPVAEVEPKP
ncbi:hypothetical protein GCM10027605_61860 [Micromonospora zhanjiangensis]